MARLLLSGASGRLGRNLLPALARCGHSVQGFGCRAPDLPHADLRDLAQLRAVLAANAPVEILIHLAALAHVGDWHSQRELMAVNVEGTGNLVAAAAAAGVRHFVLASSIEVYAPAGWVAGPVSESAPVAPASDYGRSKAEAEGRLSARAGDFERVSILRLAPVYGERLLADLRKRVVLAGPLGYRCAPAQPRHSLCHLDNLAEAVHLVVDRSGPRNAVFNVRDGSQASQQQIAAYLARRGAAPSLTVPVPRPFARALLAAAFAPRSPLASLRGPLLKAFGRTMTRIAPLSALGYRGEAGLAAADGRD